MEREDRRCPRTLRWSGFVLVVAASILPSVAQSSASYRMEEYSFNNGGQPNAAGSATSPSYRISFDAIGDPVARAGELSAPHYRMEAGFVSRYRPPGAIDSLWIQADKQTLSWTRESTVGDYSLYRDRLSALNGATWGDCLETQIASPTTVDHAVPLARDGFYYLVAARNRLMEEGSLGSSSSGHPRIPAAACP